MKKTLEVTNHHQEFLRDISLDCSTPQLTDQSDLKSSDINNIVNQFLRTGVLPNTREQRANYLDTTQQPTSLAEVYDIARRANDAFLDLPAEVRKMMDNDPANLEQFVQDEQNKDLLLKHGLIVNVENFAKQKSDAPAVAPSETK